MVPGTLRAPIDRDRDRRFVQSRRRLDQFREAKVEHFDDTVAADHHVGRLEVAVDDAPCVRGGERVGDRDGDAQQLAETHAAAGDRRVEAAPADVLHHDEVPIACRLDFVDGDDVGMVEGGGRLRFLHETPAPSLVGQPIGLQDLDRDFPPSRRSRAR